MNTNLLHTSLYGVNHSPLLIESHNTLLCKHGLMAQWLRRLPTEQEIPGSSPGEIVLYFLEGYFILDYRVKVHKLKCRDLDNWS